jgi:hypothetical protein
VAATFDRGEHHDSAGSAGAVVRGARPEFHPPRTSLEKSRSPIAVPSVNRRAACFHTDDKQWFATAQ